MKDKFPRVLLIGPEPFNYTRGYGITISNLFADWPIDHLASLYSQNITPDNTICKNQFRLSISKSRLVSLSQFLHKVFCMTESEVLQFSTVSDGVCSKANGSSNRNIVNRFSTMLGLGGTFGLGNLRKFYVDKSMREWLKDFEPEIIYCSATSLMGITFMIDMYKLIQVPLVVHVMDDWIESTKTVSGLFPKLWAHKTIRKFSWLIHNAQLRLGVSAELSKEYTNRYKVEFLPFHNCPESALWIDHGRKEWNSAVPFRFIFTGALYSSCNRVSLFEIAQAIHFLNGSEKPKYLLEIHTNSPDVNDFSLELAKLRGCTVSVVASDQIEIAKLYGSANALLLPFDFSDQAVQASRFSMPTKLPAYMLSGSPIFVYGPYTTMAVKYIADGKCGFVVQGRCSIEILARHLEQFSKNASLRRELAENARDLAKTLSAEVVRPCFIQQILGINSKPT